MSANKQLAASKADHSGAALLCAAGVCAGYSTAGRGSVLHDIDLALLPGKAVGVVGESGSGKSTLAKVLVGQLRPTSGSVLFNGRDIGGLRGRELRGIWRKIQLIPQDPYASLDPRMTVRKTLEEALWPNGRARATSAERVTELLDMVALDPKVADRYPHEFSGGQRQRIAIARALAVSPSVIIADEVTSSLDKSVQAEILNLLRSLQAKTEVAMVFITHDLSVAHYICDELCVLYLGRIVERGAIQLLFGPSHPYTRLLVDSLPSRSRFLEEPDTTVDQDPPDPVSPPSGCPFHPRCQYGPRVDAHRDVCQARLPELLPTSPGGESGGDRWAACHFPLRDKDNSP